MARGRARPWWGVAAGRGRHGGGADGIGLTTVEAADGLRRAHHPTLPAYGAATRGATREERSATSARWRGWSSERLAEEGASLPAAPVNQEAVAGERIVVTVRAPLEDAPHPA